MKTLIVYSSLTGNTKKVARAIWEVCGDRTALFPVEENPVPDDYDLVLVGFWVDRGAPDKKAQAYIGSLQGKTVGLFATLGAYPDSEHAAQSMQAAVNLLADSNRLAGTFICQGKVDPKLVEQFQKLPAGHPHAMDPARVERLREAAKHPDEADLSRAKTIFAELYRKLLAGEQ